MAKARMLTVAARVIYIKWPPRTRVSRIALPASQQ